MDYAGPFQGHNFLIVVDALTKWPEVIMMSSTTASATIKQLRELFARFGSPECIVSDNGTQFVAAETKQFFEEEGILHIRSAPFHPQSNGQAERFVDSVKRALTKAEGENSVHTVLQKYLQAYRSTHNPALGNTSPAKMMFGRDIRTIISLVKEQPAVMLERDTKMEQQFNRQHGAVKHQPYLAGDKIYAADYRTRNKRRWTPAIVIEQAGSVMYKVRTHNNKIWTRHTNQMRRRYDDDDPVTQPRQLSGIVNALNNSTATAEVTHPNNNANTAVTQASSSAIGIVNQPNPVADPVPNIQQPIETADAPEPLVRRPQRVRGQPVRLAMNHNVRGRYLDL